MKALYLLSFLSIMFLSGSVCNMISIQNTVTFAYSPFLVYFLFHTCRHGTSGHNKWPKRILLLAILFFIVKILLGENYFKIYLCFLVFPMLVAICLESEPKSKIDILRKLLLLFFVVECGLAIYEKMAGANVLPNEKNDMTPEQLMYYNPEEWEFRSESLWGHPLANAMIVAVMMSFIVISNLRMQTKLPLLLLGYVSLFCFNARGATIVTSVFIMPVLMFQIHQSKIRYKRGFYLLLIIIACYLFHILTTTSLGGRLLSGEELMDGSAQTRLAVFGFAKFISFSDILWGRQDLYLFVTEKLQAGGVENGIVTLILSHGLIITAIILFFLSRFQYERLTLFYTRKETIWLLAIFYLIGTMNPNLATPVQWTFWILCYYAFRNRKELNNNDRLWERKSCQLG